MVRIHRTLEGQRSEDGRGDPAETGGRPPEGFPGITAVPTLLEEIQLVSRIGLLCNLSGECKGLI